jgi:hypothetical protein
MEEYPMSITKRKNAAKAALVTAALTIAAGSVQAGTPYEFTVIDTTRHGAEVLEGQYEQAIARIRQDGGSDLSFGESTNLCIAYTKSGDTASALESCDRAVAIARESNGMSRFPGLYASGNPRRNDLDLVIALSNRGVVHAAAGDESLALADLREADALRPHLRAVAKNLAVLTESTAR